MPRTAATRDPSERRAAAAADKRAELLDRALAHVLEHGLGDRSLRSAAAAFGTSHRMLIYYFGSAEGFWDEVVARLQERDQLALLSAADSGRVPTIEEVWAEMSSPRQLPITRLIFELYGPALRDPGRYAGFLDQVVDGWLHAIARALHAQYELSAAEAREQARLRLAMMRGLLLDLLTTGDRKGTTAAMQAFARTMRVPERAHRKRR